MKRQSKNWKKSGETIVEVLACAVIFLMLMAVLEAAVMFATKAQAKSKSLQLFYEKLSAGTIPPQPDSSSTQETYDFSDFEITVNYTEQTFTDGDISVKIPVFESNSPAGGDEP